MPGIAALAALVLLFASGPAWPQPPAGGAAHRDLRAALTAAAERVLLPERCGECHAAEFEVWETTAHAAGFDTLHRRGRAKEIYRSLGLRLIKRGTDETTPACLSCHYTPVLRRGELRAGAGVTCESCHGAARDWVSVHNDYGVAEADFQQAALLETAEHRTQRIADSRAAGMRRPSDLYGVAANCFGCHTVPNEDLVNRGGHSTGSDFEIVAWSDRIRHNFLESYRTGDGRTNAERPRDWKRKMYVVGRALDLEYAVRGMAEATRQDELYFLAMSDRAGAAVDELLEIADRVDLALLREIIAAWGATDVSVRGRAGLRAAADLMQASTKRFIATSDGAALAALDPLWDAAAEEAAAPARVTEIPILSGRVAPPGGDSVSGGAAVPVPEPGGSGGTPRPAAAAPEPVAAAASARPAPPAAPVSGVAPRPQPATAGTLGRPSWRDPPAHAFVRVPCGRCHNAQERWWRSDPHSTAARPFRMSEPRNVEIARAYGMAAADMARGDRICMWCHGTPVSAPSRKVRAGVGCQRCHGAGADYLEPHETVGYAGALALGLTDLRDPSVQAATCAGCHYVTDPALIAAGHPVGDGFDVRGRIGDIVHWGADFGRDTRPVERAALAAAYAEAVASRGPALSLPPPAEPVAASAVPHPPAGAATQTPRPLSVLPPGAPAGAGPTAAEAVQAPVRPPRSGPGSRRGSRGAPALVDDPGLDAWPPNPDASVEEMLGVLRERVESLYRVLRGESR